jgi:hypothetical protein
MTIHSQKCQCNDTQDCEQEWAEPLRVLCKCGHRNGHHYSEPFIVSALSISTTAQISIACDFFPECKCASFTKE